MSISTPELVLFDLDGTLVDSVPDLAFSVNATLNKLSFPEHELASVRDWVGEGLEKLLHRALTNDMEGWADENLFNQAFANFMEIYTDNMCSRSDCYPGVKDGLAALQSRGIPLGCVTNKRGRFVDPILEHLGLGQALSIVVAGDTLQEKKPHPMPLLHAAQEFNVNPEQALMVGDSESDVKAARAADFQIVCVSYGYNHGRDIHDLNPDAVIDSLAELQELFH